MRSFLRFLLLFPMLATLLGFASVHYEESAGEDLPFTRSIEVGAYQPWLTWQQQASHASPEQFTQELLTRMAEEGESSTASIAVHYEEHSTWSFAPMTMSLLSGLVFVVLALFYRRLRPQKAPQGRSTKS